MLIYYNYGVLFQTNFQTQKCRLKGLGFASRHVLTSFVEVVVPPELLHGRIRRCLLHLL
jgi:hypothetical protein